MADGLCSPSAQRTASVMFDLPDPFGPTITLTPGEKVSRVRSGKDLKPFRLIAFRYMEVGRVPGTESLAPSPDATPASCEVSPEPARRPPARPPSCSVPSR